MAPCGVPGSLIGLAHADSDSVTAGETAEAAAEYAAPWIERSPERAGRIDDALLSLSGLGKWPWTTCSVAST